MNKVLFKAAVILNIAAASLIYVACSGDDGEKGDAGQAGASCVGTPSATVPGGIDITCGTSFVGTLPPGTAGAPGAPGAQGPDGPQGPSGGTGPSGEVGCFLTPATVGFDVVCEGETVGNIGGPGTGGSGGCLISSTQGDPYFNFTCPGGTTYQLAKATCNYTEYLTSQAASQPYDPDVQMCILSGNGAGVNSGCDGAPLDLTEQFCIKATASASSRVPHDRCGPEYLKKTDGTDSLDANGKRLVDPANTGEYNPGTQFCKIASIVNAPTNSGFLTGKIETLCAGNKYTSHDFCAPDAKIYLLCSPSGANVTPIVTGVYNPATHFCQSQDAAVQTPGTPLGTSATAEGKIKPRCGTSTPVANFGGKGSYAFADFCFPAAGGAGSVAQPKCVGSVANSYSPAIGTLPEGEYNPTTHYCELKITVASTTTPAADAVYAATAKPISLSLCGSITPYNPTLYECATGNIVTRNCGSGFNPALHECDLRTVTKANQTEINALAVDAIIKSSGKKFYPTVTIGDQTWLAENLAYDPDDPAVPSPDYAYDWSEALEACPDGWSLPTVAQWNTLIAASGANPGRDLRSVTGWSVGSPTTGNGFEAKPISTVTAPLLGAAITEIPPFAGVTGPHAIWWTADEDPASEVGGIKNNAFAKYFAATDVVVLQRGGVKLANNLQVRCIKN